MPMDHEDKYSKTYVVKINKYDTGNPEEFLRWRLILNEELKNHGYSGNYEMVMNLVQAMLAVKGGPKTSKTRHARPRSKQSILRSSFMIAQFFNWQSMLLISKVDGEIPLRGSAST
jgi:predicted small integral membrane protein